jgi:hypothetical protein
MWAHERVKTGGKIITAQPILLKKPSKGDKPTNHMQTHLTRKMSRSHRLCLEDGKHVKKNMGEKGRKRKKEKRGESCSFAGF